LHLHESLVPRQLASAPSRPRVVFSRDNTSDVGKRPPKPAHILIVEDDHLVASEMEDALLDAGFDVAGVASSADEVLQLAADHKPQLVVMDIRLNGKRDGVDAAIDLFSLYGIRCVFATAHQAADTRKRAEPAKPLAWIAKPYTMASLIEVVRKAVYDLKPQ
jgi:DNA-binding NarL/FixJ family response regulator